MLHTIGDGSAWASARFAVQRGWAITPGTFLAPPAGITWAGYRGASRLTPISPTWWQAPIRSQDDVDAWWSQAQYGVLLVCGHGIDAIEVTTEVFASLATTNASTPLLGPVIAVSANRRVILTTQSQPELAPLLPPEYGRWLCGASWVPLPPTRITPHLTAVWKYPPSRTPLPEAASIHREIRHL